MAETCYDRFHQLRYVGDATCRSLKEIAPEANSVHTVLKSMIIKDGIEHYCERVEVDGKNVLLLTSNVNANYKVYGIDSGLQPEDPRMVLFQNEIYIVFNVMNPNDCRSRMMCISPYNSFEPTKLFVEGMTPNPIEKNWSPFVKNDQLYFIYTYDPMVVLRYDMNKEGKCEVVYRQDNITLPINTACYLRGGSNLVHFADQYYIGLCHSRISATYLNVGGYDYNYYLPFLVLIDTTCWRLVHLSKPLMFKGDRDQPAVKKLAGSNIIFDEGAWMCTLTPTAINSLGNQMFLITANINEHMTVKYLLKAQVMDCDYGEKSIGTWDQLAKQRSIELVRRASATKCDYF